MCYEAPPSRLLELWLCVVVDVFGLIGRSARMIVARELLCERARGAVRLVAERARLAVAVLQADFADARVHCAHAAASCNGNGNGWLTQMEAHSCAHTARAVAHRADSSGAAPRRPSGRAARVAWPAAARTRGPRAPADTRPLAPRAEPASGCTPRAAAARSWRTCARRSHTPAPRGASTPSGRSAAVPQPAGPQTAARRSTCSCWRTAPAPHWASFGTRARV